MTYQSINLLTNEGIRTLDNRTVPETPFENEPVTAGASFQGKLAVIVNWKKIWLFENSKWEQQAENSIRLNCIQWTWDGQLLIGTENAQLAWVRDRNLEYIDSFNDIPERKYWTTPIGNAPDVRSLAVSRDGTIYANIHVGWIARSLDSGRSWTNLRDGLEMDVHQVSVHPINPATVFVATADGFYISKNHGETFRRRNLGISPLYARACTVFENDTYLMSVSRGPIGKVGGTLFRNDDGEKWYEVKGLPDSTERNINTYQLLSGKKGNAWVVINNNSVYHSQDYGLNWELAADGFSIVYGLLGI